MSAIEFLPNFGHTLAECDALNVSHRTDILALARRGLTFSLSTDFALLKAVNAENRAAKYGPLMPIFDPDWEQIGADNGFWVSAKRDGRVIAVMAARLREVPDLLASLKDNTFLMGPTPPAAASAVVEVAGMDAISGPVVFIGALWVHPDERGDYLSRLMVNAVVRNGWYRWSARLLLAVIKEKDLHLARKIYRFRLLHGEVRITDPRWKFPVRCPVLTISGDEVRARFLQMGSAQ